MDHSTAPPIHKRNKISEFVKNLKTTTVTYFHQETNDGPLSEASQLQNRRASAAVDDDGNRGWSIGRIVIIVLIGLVTIGGIGATIQNYNHKNKIMKHGIQKNDEGVIPRNFPTETEKDEPKPNHILAAPRRNRVGEEKKHSVGTQTQKAEKKPKSRVDLPLRKSLENNRKTEINKKVIPPKVINGIYDPIVDKAKAPQREQNAKPKSTRIPAVPQRKRVIDNEKKAPQKVRIRVNSVGYELVSNSENREYNSQERYVGVYQLLEETPDKIIYQKSNDKDLIILSCEKNSKQKECEIRLKTNAVYTLKIRRYPSTAYKTENERTGYFWHKKDGKLSGDFKINIESQK